MPFSRSRIYRWGKLANQWYRFNRTSNSSWGNPHFGGNFWRKYYKLGKNKRGDQLFSRRDFGKGRKFFKYLPLINAKHAAAVARRKGFGRG